MVAVTAGGCAAALGSIRTSVAVTGLGYLLFVGFLFNSHGVLSWDGGDSVGHLLVLAMATGLGLAQRWMRTVQADLEFDAALCQLLDDAGTDEHGDHRPPA